MIYSFVFALKMNPEEPIITIDLEQAGPVSALFDAHYRAANELKVSWDDLVLMRDEDGPLTYWSSDTLSPG